MSSKPISLSDFPLLPAIDRKLEKQLSLAPVIHSSLSGWNPAKSYDLFQHTITERNDSDDFDSLSSSATTSLSETTDGYSTGIETESDDDVDWEANARDYLDRRVEELTDEYFRKSDFTLV